MAPPSGLLSPAFNFLAPMFGVMIIYYFEGTQVSVVKVASTVVPSLIAF